MEEEAKTAEVVLYDKQRAGLAALKVKYRDKDGNVIKYEVAKTEGLALARKGRAELRGLYVDLEKSRKDQGEDARKFIKNLNLAASELDAEIRSMFDPIDKQIKEQEALIEKQREEKKQAEQKRKDDIHAKIDELKAPSTISSLSTSAEILPILEDRKKLVLNDDEYAEFVGDAHQVLSSVITLLGNLLDMAMEKEKEEARLKAERDDLERQKAEQAEKDRIAEEERLKKEEEQKARFEAEEKEREERQKKEDEGREKQLRAEMDERDRIQAEEDKKRAEAEEKLKAEQEALDKQAEEQKAKDREQQLEKDRMDEQRWRFRLSQLKEVGSNGQEVFDRETEAIITTFDALINLSDEDFEVIKINHNNDVAIRVNKRYESPTGGGAEYTEAPSTDDQTSESPSGPPLEQEIDTALKKVDVVKALREVLEFVNELQEEHGLAFVNEIIFFIEKKINLIIFLDRNLGVPFEVKPDDDQEVNHD